LIRGAIGYGGILLSDDLGMRALSGDLAERAVQAIDAGCDIALYGNGTLAESEAVLADVPDLPPATADRLERLLGSAAEHRRAVTNRGVLARLNELLAAA
jgi:beta-N-acetylhexosaminidase